MIIGGFIFVLGLIFGSFLNALEYRLEAKKSLKGRSLCPKCKHTINWHDNIPVLSWLSLRGRCRQCNQPISFQYPLIEILTGLAFLAAGIQTGLTATFPGNELLLFLILSSIYFILILVALYDAKTKYVLSAYTYLAAALALIYNLLHFSEVPTITNIYNFIWPFLASGLVAAGLFWLIWKISKGKAMGAGDAEIASAVGLLLGWPNTLIALYFAFIVGATWGVYLLSKKKAKLKSELPFGPFIISGAFFAMFFGEQIVAWYAKIFLAI